MCIVCGLAEGDGVEEKITDFLKGLLTLLITQSDLLPFSILTLCCLSTKKKITFDVLVPWKRGPNTSKQDGLLWTVIESFVLSH